MKRGYPFRTASTNALAFGKTTPSHGHLIFISYQKTNLDVVNHSSPSTYCFDVEVLQRFFSTIISVKSFARSMRAYNNEISLTFMVLSDSKSEEPIPSEVVKGATT